MLRFAGNDEGLAGKIVVAGFDGSNTAFDFLEVLEALSGLPMRGGPISVASRDSDGHLAYVSYGDSEVEGVVGGDLSSSAAQLIIHALALPDHRRRAARAGLFEDVELQKIGVDIEFCTQVRELLSCNSSAICFLVWNNVPDCSLDPNLLSAARLLQRDLCASNECDLMCKLGWMTESNHGSP